MFFLMLVVTAAWQKETGSAELIIVKSGLLDISVNDERYELKELEIHATTLNADASSHAGYNHPDEEIVLMRIGNVDETINDITQDIGPGSMMFLTNDDMHGIINVVNSSMCEYYAFRWLIAA